MKKILLSLLLLASCSSLKFNNEPQPVYVNRWCGTVLIVNVFYEFSSSGTYLQGTFSTNNVQIGGTRGLWKRTENENVIRLHQFDEYVFDNDTLKGEWVSRPKIYDVGVNVIEDTIYIDVDQNSDIVMYLPRCKEY